MTEIFVAVFWTVSLATIPYGSSAQTRSTAGLHGVTTTSAGTVTLPGVTVTAVPAGGAARSSRAAVSDSDGHYTIRPLTPGVYTVTASLAGFRDVTRQNVIVTSGQEQQLDFDIPLAVAESATARADPLAAPATGASTETLRGRTIDVIPVKGDDFMSLLPIVPGVLRGTDGRLSMKGGRPAQTGLQMGQATVADPTIGSGGFDLPVDAIDQVEVLPNPYGAEFGRFSSGLVKLETNRGTDTWRFTANNLIPVPCLKICDGVNVGIRSYDPRLIVGGPIRRGRLFISESVQAHYNRDRALNLPSNGGGDSSRTALFNFTRVDLNAGRHLITATHDWFPSTAKFVNLNAFNPKAVTANVRQRGFDTALVDAWRPSATTLVEQTVNVKRHRVNIEGQEAAGGLTMTPAGNAGNFFNRQERRSTVAQWVGSMTLLRRSRTGDHVGKFGGDVLHATFNGTTESNTVDVRRLNGSLAERIEFAAPSRQQMAATNASFFAQDTWRMTDRVLVEAGLRVDRDGVTRHFQAGPRVGFVFGVAPNGRSVVRGGAGQYADRTPLLAGAFESLETRRVTRFGPAGDSTGSTMTFANRIVPGLRSPSSVVWNAEFDQRVRTPFLLKINHLERSGAHELVIDPVLTGSSGELRLSSTGRSRYRETEMTFKYVGGKNREVVVTYVYSHSEADLNAFDLLFGNLRMPIIRGNAYGRTNVDVPHRLIARAAWQMVGWSVAPLVEFRSGLPYSVIDQEQNFVGQRNSARFPNFFSADLNISRITTIKGRRVRLGVRANHLFNNWTPRDVQANVDAPAFGTYYNSLPWKFGLTFEIQR